MYLYPQPAQRRPALGALPMSAKRRPIPRRRFAGLGAASSTALVSPQQFCGSNCKNTAFITELQNAIQNRLLQWPPLAKNATCSSAPASSGAAKVTQAASQGIGAAAGVTGALTTGGIIGASAATAAIPIVGAIAAPVLLILGTIFSNHAKAVQLQSNVLCENIPAANAALQQIDAGLAAGTITAAQALSAYSQIQTSFTAAMKSDPSYKTGDALWGYNQELQAVIAQRTLDLQNGVGTSGAPIAAGSSFAAGATSLPSWLPWVAIGGLIYLFS
jgi:hypothetical protein